MKRKRLCALLLAVVLMLGLCACGTGKEEKNDKNGTERSNQTSQTAEYKAGDYMTFGSYPQTASGTDDTPIEWLVLESDGETALLISRYGLDCQPYHTEYVDTTWEQCTLRSWLNNEFYNRAFNDEEKRGILASDVSADENPRYSTNPGEATKDNVFILSIVEAEKYFARDKARMCVPTNYAIQQGAWTSDVYAVDGIGACWWWLRSPGLGSDDAAFAYGSGHIYKYGSPVSISYYAERPCVRVRLSELPSDYEKGKKTVEERSN